MIMERHEFGGVEIRNTTILSGIGIDSDIFEWKWLIIAWDEKPVCKWKVKRGILYIYSLISNKRISYLLSLIMYTFGSCQSIFGQSVAPYFTGAKCVSF